MPCQLRQTHPATSSMFSKTTAILPMLILLKEKFEITDGRMTFIPYCSPIYLLALGIYRSSFSRCSGVDNDLRG